MQLHLLDPIPTPLGTRVVVPPPALDDALRKSHVPQPAEAAHPLKLGGGLGPLLWQDGPASVGQLGERLALDSNTLSPLLKRLEAEGLVARTRDTTDERTVVVSLTAAGARLEQDAKHGPEAICAAAGTSRRGQEQLVATLQELSARLES